MRSAPSSAVACLLLACGGEVPVVEPSGVGGASTTTGVGGETSASTSSGGAASSSGSTGGAGGAAPMTCAPANLSVGETELTITFDGNERTFDVQVPAAYDNGIPVPLVLDLHGYSSNKEQQEAMSGWNELAESEGVIVVRPNGYGALRSWNAGGVCCGSAQSLVLDDVGLMKAILAEVTSQAGSASTTSESTPRGCPMVAP